ncbi:34607_t:CDS:2 [Gigaspora margarita]|uniref:34607_t:CDS:1 n=1 Tax=Gigaspora margarita TaxID=4874 RepID=A0ABM8W2W6_GIGMA|nr:34607_t:CDS:2 [Gigaspora margarita]
MHETQLSQINSPAISLHVYQNIPLVNKSDIQFVHYNSQILSREERFDNGVYNDDTNSTTLTHAELRRQIHIKVERRRCAVIKDAFEKLHKELQNTYTGRKMSKVALLQKTVSCLENSSRKENMLLNEIKRLNQNCDESIMQLDHAHFTELTIHP